eukprot:4337513-Prymnesium_polylepis.1
MLASGQSLVACARWGGDAGVCVEGGGRSRALKTQQESRAALSRPKRKWAPARPPPARRASVR